VGHSVRGAGIGGSALFSLVYFFFSETVNKKCHCLQTSACVPVWQQNNTTPLLAALCWCLALVVVPAQKTGSTTVPVTVGAMGDAAPEQTKPAEEAGDAAASQVAALDISDDGKPVDASGGETWRGAQTWLQTMTKKLSEIKRVDGKIDTETYLAAM
jgi:hypothetical protein